MKLNHLFAVLLTAATATSALAQKTTLIIPSAGSGQGAGAMWHTELSMHNASTRDIPIDVQFHGNEGPEANNGIALRANRTFVSGDLIADFIGRPGQFGALVIVVDQNVADKLAATARAVATTDAGTYGQALPVYRSEDALIPGDTGVLIGPGDAGAYRFNFGVYPIETTEIEWTLLRESGEVAATRTVTYPAQIPVRYNAGIDSLFGVPTMDEDAVRARIVSGRAIPYGSMIDTTTNDASYVPAVRVHENIAPVIEGVDLDENGTIDLRDEDGDGTADGVMEVFTSTFPNYFRIVAHDEEGDDLTYQIVNQTQDMKFIDDEGTIQWAPGPELRGAEGVLIVRVRDGIDSTQLTIPVIFR